MTRRVGEKVKIVKRDHPRKGQMGEIVEVYPNLTNRSTQQYRVEFSDGSSPTMPNKNIQLNFIRHISTENFFEMDVWDA